MKESEKREFEFPLISFFTGGGFLDMGFEQAGFKVRWTNEVNPVFAEMYGYGMTMWKQSRNPAAEAVQISDKRSITNITAQQVLKAAFSEKKPKKFGIIGGPPCHDFSTGGKNHGSNGKNGRLSRIYVNRICEIKPSFFIFENVPGLYKTKVHRKFLLRLERKLERNGYRLDLKILNALEMGVPQDRERLIIVGIQKKYAALCAGRNLKEGERGWFSWPQFPEYSNAKTRFPWPGTHGAKRAALRLGIPLELTVHPLLNGNNPPSKKPNGTEGFKPKSRRFLTVLEGDTGRKSFKRLHRYRFSPTVCYGHNEVHLHPWENRRLTVREAMRIQGIPDEYALQKNIHLTPKFAMIANGVPVPMAHKVALSLRSFLEKGEITGEK